MMGKLLSIDLKGLGVAVAIVHTGYLRVHKDGVWEGGEGEKGGKSFYLLICERGKKRSMLMCMTQQLNRTKLPLLFASGCLPSI
jgi:hypothetical protein